MGFKIEDNCVGCERCARCGRNHESVFYCDECEDYTHELYEYEGKELCWDCYKAKFPEKLCDDLDDTLCAECGKEAEYLYKIEGNEWCCEECLKNMAERVDTE